jgi:hypothetical protein
MSEITQREIAALLDKTLAAHSVHEERELHGVYDQEWPAWYAAYLVEHGIGDLLGQAITPEQLAGLLKQYDVEYRTQPRTESWPEYYATQLLMWRDEAVA